MTARLALIEALSADGLLDRTPTDGGLRMRLRDTPDIEQRTRELAHDKLPHIDALIARAQAVKHWLQVAQSCDCASVDVCGLFVDPTLMPPAGDIDLDVRQVKARGRR